MKRLGWLLAVIAVSAAGLRTQAALPGLPPNLRRINACLHGQVLDFTHNHGHDNRIWSAALCEKRDLYVLLPPCYDPRRQYPLAIYLHGAAQDEQFFLKNVAKGFDDVMASGKLPPFILAVPDGSIKGRPSFLKIASFWANTKAGNFEDFLMVDVWNFMMENFSIRPEREAHVLMGVSMGGSAAFAQAIKHRDRVKVAIGFMPALNLRWVDCHDRYWSEFDPCCWGWRTRLKPCEVIGKPKELVKIRFHNLFGPLIGYGPDAMERLSRFNPIEILDEYDLKPGELSLYAAYGGKDEFNIPAQVESFLYRAHERGLEIGVGYDPEGRHDLPSGRKLMPAALNWVAPLIEPYRVK